GRLFLASLIILVVLLVFDYMSWSFGDVVVVFKRPAPAESANTQIIVQKLDAVEKEMKSIRQAIGQPMPRLPAPTAVYTSEEMGRILRAYVSLENYIRTMDRQKNKLEGKMAYLEETIKVKERSLKA